MRELERRPRAADLVRPPAFRICYRITLYRKFDQALRLVRRLAGPDTAFVFHIDRAVNPHSVAGFRAALADLENIAYCQSIRWKWSSYNGTLAIFPSVQVALRMGRFDR